MSCIKYFFIILIITSVILITEYYFALKYNYKLIYIYNPAQIGIFQEECPNLELLIHNNIFTGELRTKIAEEKLKNLPYFEGKDKNDEERQKKNYQTIVSTLVELIPIETNKCLIRVGKKNDGGYVLLNHELDKVDYLYSYGIEYDTYFERMFADRFGAKVYLYDNTINYVPYHNNFFFFKENIGESQEYNSFSPVNTLSNHLNTNNHKGKRKILKLDIEGEEYRVLKSLDVETLLEFDQIILEMHKLIFLYDSAVPVLQRINKYFYLYHVHFNNYGEIYKVKDLLVPGILELSWVRKDLIKDQVTFANKVLPSVLDMTNNPYEKDYYLDFWPFKLK